MSNVRNPPAWLRPDGVRYVEYPEPPHVQKYVGGHSATVVEDYAESLAPAQLQRLREDGFELLSLRFFAGFGCEFEAPEMQRFRETAAAAHAAGLKVAARIALGWAVPETLSEEDPESPNWMQLTHDGKFVWGPHSYQCRPCYNSEGWLRCVEKAAAAAIDAGADAIFFDSAAYSPSVRACHCPLCVVGFRDFLRAKYGNQTEASARLGLDRFGHNTFVHVRPPVEALAHRIASPHQQEWLSYKIQTLADALARLARFVRRRNPACAVGADVFDTFFSSNSEYLFGIDPSRWLSLVDLAVMREPRLAFPAEWSGADRAQRALNARIAARLSRAFGAVFVDFLQAPVPEDLATARLAVFHDTPSATFNSSTSDSRHEIEIMLMQYGVPFEILHAGNLGRLADFPCVVLPNCECLSDELAATFQHYADAGGGLILTEQTGQRDPWRRQRKHNVFPAIARLDRSHDPLHLESGSGRIVYLPEVRERWTELESAVKWLMREEPALPVQATL